ncbi:MAG: hypothetical protein ACAI25_09745, partial [Planctomycetota bacterium]
AGSLLVGAALALDVKDGKLALERLRLLDARPPLERERAARRAREVALGAHLLVARAGDTAERRALSTIELVEKKLIRPTDVETDLRGDVRVHFAQLLDRGFELLAAVAAGTKRDPEEALELAKALERVENVREQLGVPPPEYGSPAARLREGVAHPELLQVGSVVFARLPYLARAQLAWEAGDLGRALRELDKVLEISIAREDDVYCRAWKDAFCILIEQNQTDAAFARVAQAPSRSSQKDVVLARAWAWLAKRQTALISEIPDVEAKAKYMVGALALFEQQEDEALARSAHQGEAFFLRGMLRVAVVRSEPGGAERREGVRDLARAVAHPGTPARLRVRAGALLMALVPSQRSWVEKALAGDRSPPRW